MTVESFLSRLVQIKQTGPRRWIACCPAHEDSSPSLSVRELDDRRILVKCFAECSTADVLESVGLRMADLFPEPLSHHIQPSRARIPAQDLLALISLEAHIVCIIGADMLRHRAIPESDWQRLLAAVRRIERAMEHIRG